MSIFRKITVGVVACLLTAGLFVPHPAFSQNAGGAAAIKAIDTDCSAIQNAIMALHPVHVALVNNTWKVLSDADYTVAEQTRASITLVDAWKQGTSYAWIHSHSFDARGNQRATQLCFRQAGGTLERARQAATMADINGASVQEAYFASDGALIAKVGAFEVNDPAIAKTVQALPFYSVLP